MPESEIVSYKRGKSEVSKRIDPKVLELIMLDDIQVALKNVNEHLKKAEFQGKLDPRTLSITDQIQGLALIHDWPFTPWITASFHNDGPNTAYIAINLIFDWTSLNKGEDMSIDFSKSDNRIQFIHYRCDRPGDTASVRVVGKY